MLATQFTMKVVTTFHPASSVVDSLKFRLKDEHPSEFLVIAKSNRLDIYALLPEGLRHQQGLDIWGRVRVIRAVPVLVSNNCKKHVCSVILRLWDSFSRVEAVSACSCLPIIQSHSLYSYLLL